MLSNMFFMQVCTIRNRLLAGVALAATPFVLPSSVSAQPLMPSDASVSISSPTDDGTIYVTARKREESLQSIPDSITAFTADRIASANIQNVKDVATQLPNLSIVEAQQPGLPIINIRGIGQARNGEAPVAVVLDGVQLANASQITQDLFDIERIEVLKGPQGATYGRNAIGGAINIVSRRPTNDFQGSAQLGYGSGDDWRGAASVSGPIIQDKLLFRVAGSFRDFDGDIPSLNTPGRTEANWDKDRNVRASLIAKPTETLSIDLAFSRLYTKAGAAYYAAVTDGTSPDTPLPYAGNIPGVSKRILNDLSAKVDLDLGGATLSSVTAHSKTYTSIYEDLEYTPIDGTRADQRLHVRNISQEIRLTSNGDGPLKWMGGVYYLNTRQVLDTKILLGADFLPLFGLDPALSPFVFATSKARDDNNAYAAFGQASYHFDSGVELTSALRYDIDRRHQTDEVALGMPEYRKTFRSLQPKASASYFFDPDTMIYATVAKGFRSGGFNPQDRIVRQFKKEENWNYEAGFKSLFGGRRINLNGAIFYTQVKDRQVYILDILTSSQTFLNPIPKSYIYGAELEAAIRPIQGMELAGSIGLLQSKIKRYDRTILVNAGLPPQGDYTGNELPQMAGISYAFSAQYKVPVSSDLTLTPRIEFNGSGGDYYWEIDNATKRGAINLVNLRLSLAYKSLTVTGYAENLLKERYTQEYVAKEWSGASLNYSAAARGRRFGVRGRIDF